MKAAKRIVSIALLVGACGAQCLTAAVVITPGTANLKPGQSIQFSATGSPIGVYLWSISGTGCEGISCGYITSDGFYTAPAVAPQPSTVIVQAMSLADLSQFATALVTVGGQPVISVSLTPQQVTVGLNAKQQFTAAVTGTANTAVSWSLSGYGCIGPACGTITSAGVFTAPAAFPNAGIVFVKATSNADNSKSATATVYFSSSVAVSVTPSSASVKIGSTQQFKATVTGTNSTKVTWSVNGSGCSGTNCGIISSAGLYTAPATAPNPNTVSVTATSTADGNAFATAIVTIVAPISVTISPASVSVISGGQVQFSDTVGGTTNKTVNWSVSGVSCSGTACGTVSSSGLYTSPSGVLAPMSVNVTVTSQASSSVSASAAVSILVSSNAKLSGRYAFLFNGFDKNGVYQAAGSIQVDGKGKISSGTEDVNYTINPAAALSVTGTYQVTSDNRGSLTIKSPLGTQTLCIVMNSSDAAGRLISCDQSGIQGSGVIYRQDATAFHASSFTDGYVASLVGSTITGGRIGALGLIFPDGAGFIAGSSLDVNEEGNVPPTFPSFYGNYTLSSTGRGTMTWAVPGFDAEVFHFAFYVVSKQELLLVSMDPMNSLNPIFCGPAVLQQGGWFTPDMFAGGSVFSLSGLESGKGDDTVGRILFESDGGIEVKNDRNSAGKVSIGVVSGGAYDVEINGRGDLNFNSGDNWLFYATAPNQGFLMDTSSSEVRMGEMTPQIQKSFDNATLVGNYVLGSSEPVVRTSPLYTGSIHFDGGNTNLGNGSVSGTEDISQLSALLLSKGIQGTYSISLVSDDGHGTILLTAPQKVTIDLWATGPLQAVGLQVDSSASYPTVLYIEK